ncbi:MAG: DUF1641 domain-containing protein [Thermoflavifilum sp.]|nr:DUF1641 domain-containing protein [Thermoflavifilum sp.]MCL6514238.1 DUF1641 domain-containing protein [Alicyclobacillus sp.]
MAKPIQTVVQFTPDPQAASEKALLRLLQAVAEEADAVEEALRVVRGLHERGLLELTAAALEQGDDVLRIVVEQLNQPGAVRALQNLVRLVQQLEALNLEKMGTLLEGAANGLEEALAQPADRPLGVFGLMRALADPDISTALNALLGALRGMGRALRTTGKEG